MDWSKILNEVFITFAKTATIMGVYYITKSVFREAMVLSVEKSTLFKKISIVAVIIFTCSLIAVFFSTEKDYPDKIVINFLIVLCPSLLGMWKGIKSINKLTEEEKGNLKRKIEQENRDTEKHDEGYH